MSAYLPILLIIAALVLLTGVLAIAAIVLVSKRCKIAQKPMSPRHNEERNGVDPWKEAGNRMKNDIDEPQ
jgi:hypothetical protein